MKRVLVLLAAAAIIAVGCDKPEPTRPRELFWDDLYDWADDGLWVEGF